VNWRNGAGERAPKNYAFMISIFIGGESCGSRYLQLVLGDTSVKSAVPMSPHFAAER
jgi:hypothetical protein